MDKGARGALCEAIPRGAAGHLGEALESGVRSQICAILVWDGLGSSSTMAGMSLLSLSEVPRARPVSSALRCQRARTLPGRCLAPQTLRLPPPQYRGAAVPTQPADGLGPRAHAAAGGVRGQPDTGTRGPWQCEQGPGPVPWQGRGLGRDRMARGGEKNFMSIQSDLASCWAGMPIIKPMGGGGREWGSSQGVCGRAGRL